MIRELFDCSAESHRTGASLKSGRESIQFGEIYWKIANGIKLTGMPAHTGALSETEMWKVSLLLANAYQLPKQVQSSLEHPLNGD